MQTLAQTIWPAITSPFEFVTVAIGLLVFIALIVQIFRSKSIAPYMGMPALGMYLIAAVLFIGGPMIDMSQFHEYIATAISYIVEIGTSVAVWPFLMAAIIAQLLRVVNIASGGMIKLVDVK